MNSSGVDSILKGETSRTSRKSRAEGTKQHRGITLLASGAPSIPSRYLTIFTSNSERRGFQQTARRFHDDSNETPGPGEYQIQQSINKQLEKTSDSKKGSGSFASKSKREIPIDGLQTLAAPTSYNLDGSSSLQKKDTNRSQYSSMFQKPIVELPSSPRSCFPAPNQYDIDNGLKKINKSNNVTAHAAFQSRTRRSAGSDKTFKTPAPGSYNVDDSVIRVLPPIQQASFKSTSKRDLFKTNSQNSLPGPADYRPFDKIEEEPHRQIFPRHNYLLISAPAVPPPPEEPVPGPGAYDLRDFRGPEKKYMSSAVFVSSSSRWNLDSVSNTDKPGPTSYTPRAPAKQSFNYNFGRKWLA